MAARLGAAGCAAGQGFEQGGAAQGRRRAGRGGADAAPAGRGPLGARSTECPGGAGPEPRLDHVRVQANRPIVARRRSGEVSSQPGHPAQVVVGESHVRACLECVQEVAAGPVEEERALLASGGDAPAGKETRPVESGRDLVGVDAKRVGEGGLGLLRESQCGQRLAPVHVGLGKVGVGRQGEVELDERLRRAAGGSKRNAQAAAGLGEVGCHLQRVFEGHLGALEVACCEVLISAADLLGRAGMGRRGGAGEEGEGGGEQEVRGATRHGERRSEGRADTVPAKVRGRSGRPVRAQDAEAERRPRGATRALRFAIRRN